jgi:phosphomannomutase
MTGVVQTPIKFGTDGWRAIIAEDFTFGNVRLCAQATAAYTRETGLASRGIVVGYDTRFQSDRFAEAVAEVLAANDIPVYLCDRPAPTPVIGYSILDRNAAGSVVITSSHNPAIYSGFRCVPSTAPPLLPRWQSALKRSPQLMAGKSNAPPLMRRSWLASSR